MIHVIPTGNFIRRLRKAVGLTQKELARRAGLSQSLISRIERGSVDPRLSTIRKIMDVIESSTVKGELTARHIMHKPVITINVRQPIKTAVELMKKYDISQLPVVDDQDIQVGSVQESTLIRYMVKEKDFKRFFKKTVQKIMEDPFPEVTPNTSVNELLYIISQGVPAILVVDKGRILGIVAKIDLIATFLR